MTDLRSRRNAAGRIAPKKPPRVGFKVGDHIFSIFTHDVRGVDICYPGVITKLPEGRSKFYKAKYDDGDEYTTLTIDELLVKIPLNGIHYDNGRYSNIINGEVIRDIPPESERSGDESSDVQADNLEPPFTLPQRVDEEIPTISEIIQKNTSILKHVPFNCRADFSKALNSLIFELTSRNDILAWTCYFMFVPVVLLPYDRGGFKNRKKAEKFTKKRIKEWVGERDIDYRSLVLSRVKMWDELPESKKVKKSSSPEARCKRLAAEARYALACRALADAESIAPLNDQTFDILEKKHPKGSNIAPLPSPPPARVTVEQVKQAIASFPSGSAAGPSKLSPDHIKDASSSFLESPLLESITNLSNLLIEGRAPPEVQPFIAGAFLTPLVKKDGGIRPIACGDTLRRIAGKALASSVKEKANTYFAPHQLGVAVPRGAETAIHTWREFINAVDPDDNETVALKIDLQNAFNNIDRGSALLLLHHHFPELYSFMSYMYGSSSYLFIRGMEKVILSSQGAQQGDPLGPLLSCLVFHVIVNRINALDDIKLNLWYMDDGAIIGHYKSIQKVLEILDELKDSLGVFLNEAKTEIIWLNDSPHPSDPFRDTNFKLTSPKEMEMLGAPLGTRQWCNDYVFKKAISKSQVVIDKLLGLNDSQIAFLLLRACLSYSKMVYFMRTVPVGYMSFVTKAFDNMILECLTNIISFKLSEPGYRQLQLNVSNGGLGIRNTNKHHPAAFYSSINDCMKMIRTLSNSIAIHSVRLSMIAAVDLFDNLPRDAIKSSSSQSMLSAHIDKAEADLLYNQADALNKARILASRRPHAADFLFAPPIAGLGLKLTSEEWSAAVAYKLGLNLNDSTFQCESHSCNKMMDLQGWHSMRCGTEGERLRRHNKLKKFFFAQCRLANVAPIEEPPNLIRNCGLKPADWGIPDFRPGKFMAFDIAVTDPTQDAFFKKAASEPGYTAKKYAEVKRSKYADALARDESVLFTPIIAETFGGWNKEAYDLFANLASWLLPRDPAASKPLILSRLFQRASIILQRGNARMLLSRLRR
ncbi:MAG TPA: reverse transcriptase domain-containing protein [Candidatus Limnocylindrales bacterium]|nr:reverse transcriptase domain-containing protein [Candidatus Limnocylindrales bacterium]